MDFPKPQDPLQLRRFIGMMNFYQRCIPHVAALQVPLTEMLKGITREKGQLSWSAEADEAFECCKQGIVSAVSCSFLVNNEPLHLHTDASSTSIGVALDRLHPDGIWITLGFFSRKLSNTEQRYSTYAAVKYFRSIFEGRNFTIHTDHKRLSHALAQRSDKASLRQTRHLDFVAQFDATIRYTPGVENVVADAYRASRLLR